VKVQFVDDKGKVLAEVEPEAKTFKTGTKGFYFRGHTKIGPDDYHVQLIVSK
jgi:hypothetical protein